MSNDRGHGAPPRGSVRPSEAYTPPRESGPAPASDTLETSPAGRRVAPVTASPPPSPVPGRPLRGPQAGASPLPPRGPEPRSGGGPRSDEVATLYRKIAALQAEAGEAEARATKAEREQASTDEMLGQMLARVADVEARLRNEQKRGSDGEGAAPQVAKLRAALAEAQERVHTLEVQTERHRAELSQARRDASTHRLAAEDELHALAKERAANEELRARLAREQEEREALWSRLSELDRATGERNELGARSLEVAAELEATRFTAAAHERESVAKLEHAWVDLRRAHEVADVLENQLAELRQRLAAESTAGDEARRELAVARADAAETAAEITRMGLAQEILERAFGEARAEAERAQATHERAVSALREAHASEMDAALAERSRRERAAVDAEIAAGREEIAALEAGLSEAQRELERERATTAELQGVLAGEREWAAELEEDTLRREEDLDQSRRALLRAESQVRAAEARRVEIEDAHADAERRVAAGRGELEGLRVEAAMLRMRIAELERERELGAGPMEVSSVPAEVERLRRRVASAEARNSQMHAELATSIEQVTRLLTELDRRELEATRMRTASLSSARSLLEHLVTTPRPAPRTPLDVAASPAPRETATTELADPRGADAAITDAASGESGVASAEAAMPAIALPRLDDNVVEEEEDEATLVGRRAAAALAQPLEPG